MSSYFPKERKVTLLSSIIVFCCLLLLRCNLQHCHAVLVDLCTVRFYFLALLMTTVHCAAMMSSYFPKECKVGCADGILVSLLSFALSDASQRAALSCCAASGRLAGAD
jgi:hypothetical protein